MTSLDIARQEPITILFGIEQPEAGPRQRLGAEREARSHKAPAETMPSAASAGAPCRSPARKRWCSLSTTSTPGGAERECRSDRDDAARGRKRGLERNNDEPDGRERRDAAVRCRNRRHQPRQRERRQNVSALIAAGARQEIGGKDRHDEPGKYQKLDDARRPADIQINRERRERDNAAENARRDKGAMPRRRQRRLAAPTDAPASQYSFEPARAGSRSQRTPDFADAPPFFYVSIVSEAA